MSEGMLIALVAAVSNLVGGAGVWAFLTKRQDRVASVEDREVELLKQRAAAAEAKAEAAALGHQACEEKVDQIERRLDLMERHSGSWAPRWLRDAHKRIRWINDAAMITIFAPLRLSREDVEGHSFGELLDVEAAREIDRLDRAALAQPGRPVSTLLTLHVSLPPMHVFKIAGVGRDRELIYEGYCFLVNSPEDVADRVMRRQEEQTGLSQLRLGPLPGEPDLSGLD